MHKIFYFFNILAAIAIVFSYISPYVPPSATWIFAAFGLGYPFLLITNVLFVFYWLIFKPKNALLSLLFICLGYNALVKAVGINQVQENPIGFSIMTFNIGKTRVEFHRKKTRDKKVSAFKKFIQKEQPDIICIQERLLNHFKYYDQIFEGYNLYPSEEVGTAIYSKFPVIKSGNIPFNTFSHNASWVDVEIKKKKYRVYCMHLSSNRVSNILDDVSEIWDDSKSTFRSYHKHAIARADQLEKVMAHAAQSPHPVILNGDFNDVPQSYVYRTIAKEYKDAFIECGRGFAQTYNSRFIGLRIDFTFVSNELDVVGHDIVESDISDHYPVVTKISY